MRKGAVRSAHGGAPADQVKGHRQEARVLGAQTRHHGLLQDGARLLTRHQQGHQPLPQVLQERLALQRGRE